MAITSITKVTAAAAKAFIDNLEFTGITTEVSSDGVLQIKSGGVRIFSGNAIYYNNGESSFNIAANYSSPYYTVTACSNGLILNYTNRGNMFISLNHDSTVIYGATYSEATCDKPRVCRSDLENYFDNTFYRYQANCTALVNFVTGAGLGDANIAAENAYYMPMYQYSGTGVITLNNEKYITNGYWCIKD